MQKILIGVAWPYANAPIHEGHPPGYIFPADIFARYNRLRGRDVLMISGTDAHGTPNTIAAEKAGISPEQLVAINHKIDLSYWKRFDITYDYYTKTNNETHKEEFKRLFLEIYKSGYIVKKRVKYFYSKKERKALLDRYIEGICPYCGFENARGDQCDNCGKTLTPFELKSPYSIYGDKKLEIKETEDLFLDLPRLQKEVEGWFNSKDIWRTHVAQFTKSWLKDGLRPRAITRDMDWGIEIPEEINIENRENKRFYVWVEAVAGYLTASINWSKIKNKKIEPYNDDYLYENSHSSIDWKDWWLNESAKHYYFMGKDNIPFHTIIWPSMLIAANKSRKPNEAYVLPYDVPANNYMNLEGQKISKSRKWMIGLDYLLDNYDVNLIRYYFTARMPENKDADFKWKDFVDLNNNELVATLGNFIHRTLTFCYKNFDGIVPNGKVDPLVNKKIEESIKETGESLERIRLSESLMRSMKLAMFANKYFNDSEIWNVIKTDKDKAGSIIFNSIYIILTLRTILEPFMPGFSRQITYLLNLPEIKPEVGLDQWDTASTLKSLEEGVVVKEPVPIFSKLDTEVIKKEEMRLRNK